MSDRVDSPVEQQSPEGAASSGGALSALLNRVAGGLNAAGSIWIFVMMVVINCDALGRTFFTHPIEGVIEFVEMSIVAIVFLQLADATGKGKLTRSDGLFSRILEKKPEIGRVMGMIFELLGLIFLAIIIYGTIPLLTEAIDEDLYFGTRGVFTAPRWPVYLVIIVGGIVTLLQFISFFHRHVAGGKQPTESTT